MPNPASDQPQAPAGQPAAPLVVVPVTLDRVRIIRRSMRCFVYGLIGAVPFLGTALALQAILLHRRVVAETGERWKPARYYGLMGLGALCAFIYSLQLDAAKVLIYFTLFPGLWALLLWGQYDRGQVAEWHPARAYLYWGLGLAYFGLFTLATTAMVLAAVILFMAFPRYFDWLQ